MSTESLATVAKGGVSFITPKSRDVADMEIVDSGHVFQLFEKLDKDWLEDVVPIEIATNPP